MESAVAKDTNPEDPIEMLNLMPQKIRKTFATRMIGDLSRWDRATKVRIADAMGLPHSLIKPHVTEGTE
jgi:hypothetical protein